MYLRQVAECLSRNVQYSYSTEIRSVESDRLMGKDFQFHKVPDVIF